VARVGIDYGTTNTVVVASDRGHYPVVPHVSETAIGPVIRDTFPSMIVYDRVTNRPVFGADAERCLARPGAEERYAMIRSLKRATRDYAEGRRVMEDAAPGGLDLKGLLTEFLRAVRESIGRSGLPGVGSDGVDAVISWPAHANGAQRHVTRQAFRDAGFQVLAALSEPVASSIEYADRAARGNRAAARRLRSTVLIFDLGGGTLDMSLMRIEGRSYTVLATAGVESLGGDDFDALLARLFAEALGLDFDALTVFQRTLLLLHACRQKEGISAGGVRNLTVATDDLCLPGGRIVSIKADDYLARTRELLIPAIESLHALLEGGIARQAGVGRHDLDAIYLVGGASKLPSVSTLLAEHFPRTPRVITDKPFTSAAMGAAIQCSENLRLHDILSRTFGVVRLADEGTREVFSPVFPAGTPLPAPGEPPLRHEVVYTPRHSVGHLRYLECVSTGGDGQPAGGVRTWSDVLFPYDPAVPVGSSLAPRDVAPRADLWNCPVEEIYTCDSDGVISVKIIRRADGQSCTYEIFREA
jgi:molecular chaperone DnaK (HSP70)